VIAASATQGAPSSTGRRDWLRLLGATAVFLLVSAFAGFLRPSSRWLLPVALFSLVPVAVVVATIVRMLRRTDELARRVASEALALSFVTLAAMLAYPFLETLGLPALRPQMVCAVLVGSFSAGIAIFSRRYE
jgi:divalent metal cation (Fe/Co/Zn/Cd) transporter